jgi:hypothetical protein
LAMDCHWKVRRPLISSDQSEPRVELSLKKQNPHEGHEENSVHADG